MHTSPFPAFQPHCIPSHSLPFRTVASAQATPMHATGANLKQMGFRGRRRGPCASAIT
ncbi:hypothetical protein PO909_012796 [Leuciscus waleckii]